MIALDNSLRVGLKRRLSDFKLDEASLDEVLRSGHVDYSSVVVAAPTLMLSMDQGPPQYSAYWYMLYECGLNVISNFDPHAHRLWNDCKQGIKDASLMRVVLSSIVYYNYKCGPWRSSAWYRDMQSATKDARVTLTANDPLLLSLWDRICLEKQWQEPHE
eukprot:3967992-Amphidinium_carterae.1